MSSTRQTVSLSLDWRANPNHTGIIVASHRGYFAEADVEVSIIPAEPSRSPVAIVNAGEADLGVAFAGTVIEERARGNPLVSVAAVCPHHYSSLVTLASSGIHRPADLARKRYASFGHPRLEELLLTRMMEYDGVATPELDLRTVRFASVDLLVQGEIDYLWVFDAIEGIEAQVNGIELVSLRPDDYGIPSYEAPILFTNEACLNDPQRREALTRALAAIRRGYIEAAHEPDSTLDDIHAESDNMGGWLFANDAITLASQRMASHQYLTADEKTWGWHSAEGWANFARLLWQGGALDSIPEPEYHQYFTNDLLS